MTFFRRVLFLEQFGARLESMGASGFHVRSEIQRRARLTDSETAALKSVAASCESKLDEIRNQVQAVVTEARGRAPGPGPLPPSDTQKINELYAQREPIIADHVQQLKNLLGIVRFKHLDAYVRATLNVRVSDNAPVPALNQQER